MCYWVIFAIALSNKNALQSVRDASLTPHNISKRRSRQRRDRHQNCYQQKGFWTNNCSYSCPEFKSSVQIIWQFMVTALTTIIESQKEIP